MQDEAASGPTIFWEDFEPGAVREFGRYEVTADEIKDYAGQFDPQPMHLDEDAAASSMLGGLAASGWHNCAMLMRMMCDGFMLDTDSWGAPGVDVCKWLRPVRPGDVLSVRRTVLDRKASQSRPGMGVVRFRWEMRNQDGETVMMMENPIMFGRRTPGGPDGDPASRPPDGDPASGAT